MAYDFGNFKQKLSETEEWLKKEFSSIRTGSATPAILDGVMVDSYGTKAPIKQVASVMIEDARTLRVVPWSGDQIKEIESAIGDANLGLSISVDEKGVRAIFPELTAERRESLVKISKEKLEEAKITIRRERDEVWGDIQKKQQGGEMSEDEKFTLKTDMQKIVDETSKSLDKMGKRKETEISA